MGAHDPPSERRMIALAQRYRIERELGRGGMGVVHLAWDLNNRRNVAVKVLKPEIATLIGRDRFLREIEIAANLSHPHILPLHDSGEEDGELYYVMPYVQGESLAGRMTRLGMLEIQESLRITREVADALAYAHGKGIVHRDIKPANILLESGHAVVADFGMAFVASTLPSERLTSTGITLGTPIYMSPEQSLGRRHIDGRSDIYSLGCVLYEMLCGETPFGSREPQAILARKMAHPPPMCIARDTISESIERVTLKALCRNPADRFRSSAEFAHALEAATIDQHWMQEDGTTARALHDSAGDFSGEAHAIPRRTSQPTWLKRIIAVAAGAMGLCLLTGFVANAVYDLRMEIPSGHRSTDFSLIVIGAKALVPSIFFAFVWFAGYFILKQVARLFVTWVKATSTVEVSVQNWRRSSDSLRTRLREIHPRTLAEVFVSVGVVVSLVVLITFGSFLRSVWDGSDAWFSTACYPLYYKWTFAMCGVILALTGAWLHAVSFLRARRAAHSSVALVRWAGVAVIVLMTVLMQAPWRLYFENARPRATLNGQPVYVLAHEDDDLVIYNAATRNTEHYHRAGIPALTLLGTDGYVFEHETQCPTASR